MLRELHLAIERDLRETFPKAEVRKHAGEVDIETVRRHAMKRTNLWVTVAAGSGLEEAYDTALRVLVEWAVFVIVGSAVELVEDGQGGGGKKRRRATPVEVAEWHAEQVLRLAYDNDWGLEACARVRRTDLRFANLGVGLKSTARGVERSDLGLFVVWARQELDLGENILPGHTQLPPFAGFEGELEGAGGAGEPAEVELQESFPQALLGLGGELLELARARLTRFNRSVRTGRAA